MGIPNILDIASDFIDDILSFVDDAHQQGYLWIFLVGILLLAIWLIFFA